MNRSILSCASLAMAFTSIGCSPGGSHGASGGAPPSTGGASSGGTTSGGGASGGSGGFVPVEPGGPRYHPPSGFEDCLHAEVKAKCDAGWCELPPSCFVAGTPEDDWQRGLYTEDQVAVTLTHTIEMQQTEMTRGFWRELTGVEPQPSPGCETDTCPVTWVNWWDAVTAANLLSVREGYEPCYEPVGCTGTLGVAEEFGAGDSLECTGFEDPEKVVYECEGYRLPTRAELLYATKAGTITTFPTGDITIQEDRTCRFDQNLDPIAWYCMNSGDHAHEVGTKAANGFGLHDVLGNVIEHLNDPDWSGMSYAEGENPFGRMTDYDRRANSPSGYHLTAVNARPTYLHGTNWNSASRHTGFRLARTKE